MSKKAVIITIIFTCVCVATGQDEESQKAWQELFSQGDPLTAEQQFDAVLSACDNDAGKLKALIAADTFYAEWKPGWHEQTTTMLVDGNPVENVFYVRIPKGYTPARAWPAVLAVHASGGTGMDIGDKVVELLGESGENYVILAPLLPDTGKFTGLPVEAITLLKPLGWARLNLNIDDDRVHVVGYSLGGRCAWHLAVMYARLFADGVSMAGVPMFEGGHLTYMSYLENIDNLPFWAVWGKNDVTKRPYIGIAETCREVAAKMKQLKNKNFTATELANAGHGDAWPPAEKFEKYLAAHKRNAVPLTFRHYFHLAHQARGYYLEAVELGRKPLDFNKKIRVKIPEDEEKTPETAQKVMAQHIERARFKFNAKLDRDTNTLTVNAGSITKLKLYVVDGMFDLSKPVTIKLWSKTWKGEIPASARCMLTNYAADRDQTCLILNELELNINGKVNVLYP